MLATSSNGVPYGLTLPVIRNLKPKTWYAGLACRCGMFLCVTEDTAADREGDDVPISVSVAAECECGRIARAQSLRRRRWPG